jgi:hypothetical protein
MYGNLQIQKSLRAFPKPGQYCRKSGKTGEGKREGVIHIYTLGIYTCQVLKNLAGINPLYYYL